MMGYVSIIFSFVLVTSPSHVLGGFDSMLVRPSAVQERQIESMNLLECEDDLYIFNANYICNVSHWMYINLETRMTCTAFDDIAVPCITAETSQCPSDIRSKVPGLIAEFRARKCVAGTQTLTDHAQTLFQYAQDIGEVTLMERLSNIYDDVNFDDCDELFSEDEASSLEEYTRVYDIAFKCLRVEISRRTEDNLMKSYAMYWYYLYIGLGFALDPTPFLKEFKLPETRAPQRATVTVFGDPHLRVFRKGYVTCGAPGQKNYLRNMYMVIKGNNTAAMQGSEATYMTAVYMDFRDEAGNVFASYQASDTLSKTFTDGESEKRKDSDNELTIISTSTNGIRIKSDASGASIVLRKYGRTYMMSIRMAENLLEESAGLLVQGCLDDIDISGTQRRRKRADVCGSTDASLKAFCLYDFSVTGDSELAESVNAVMEVEEEASELDSELSDPWGPDNGGIGLSCSSSLAVTVLLAWYKIM